MILSPADRAIALLMREVLCEQVFRERENWNADHPCRALGLRTILPEEVARHASSEILGYDGNQLKAHAARVLDEIIVERQRKVLAPVEPVKSGLWCASCRSHVAYTADAGYSGCRCPPSVRTYTLAPGERSLLALFEPLLDSTYKKLPEPISPEVVDISRRVFEAVAVPEGLRVFIAHTPVISHTDADGNIAAVMMAMRTLVVGEFEDLDWFVRFTASGIENEMSGKSAFYFYTIPFRTPLQRWVIRCGGVRKAT